MTTNSDIISKIYQLKRKLQDKQDSTVTFGTFNNILTEIKLKNLLKNECFIQHSDNSVIIPKVETVKIVLFYVN